MPNLYLVRHGESAWNTLRLYTGQRDVPLSERGQLQVQRVAEHLQRTAFEMIYSSPLRRAHDTASAIANLKQMALHDDTRLAEISHGAWEGNSVSVVREQYADEYDAWRTQPHTVQMPDGESLEDVAERVGNFLQEVFARHSEGNVLIVSHDAVLRVIVLQTLGLGLEYFWRWRFDNASCSVVEQRADGQFRLALLNDVHYLEGIISHCDAQAL
ncbi:MAG TPA: alpha-ribazole phosphatase [Anaerolineae bacterium]|nr:alpha-ribazole phosphatase [Anaerolineae bacterium]